MTFLEMLALSILFFNIGKGQEYDFEVPREHIMQCHYRSYPYIVTVDDDFMSYFSATETKR
jgi:hypothetical protein